MISFFHYILLYVWVACSPVTCYISLCSIVQQCIVSSKPNQRVLYNSIVCIPIYSYCTYILE